MAAMVECYAHIPGIQLAGAEDFPIGPYYNLGHLPFEDWLALEDPAMIFYERRYRQNMPVFLKGAFELEGQPDEDLLAQEVQTPFRSDAARLSTALLFTLWDPSLPDPLRSATYFRIPGEDASYTANVFGLNERDLLLTSYAQLPELDSVLLTHLDAKFTKLFAIQAGEGTPEIMRVVNAVKVGFEPGMGLLDMIVHFVAAHEDILNPKGDRPLGRTFGERAGLFFCPDFKDLARWQRLFELLYEARSDALHGRPVDQQLEEIQQLVTDLYRFLFFHSYQTCCHLAYLASDGLTLGAGLVGPLKTTGAPSAARFARFKEKLHLDWLEG